MENKYIYEVFVGSEKTMNSIKEKGARALNLKTNKWQIIDKDAKYFIRIDKTIPDEYSETGFTNCCTLLSDKDLRTIAKEKGLII